MTNSVMYDACTPSHIPPGGDLVAGYVDPGECKWPRAYLEPGFWAPCQLVTITRNPDYRADVLDVEHGAATVSQVSGFLKAWWPNGGGVIYCDRSNLPGVTTAMKESGLYSNSGIWLAYPGADYTPQTMLPQRIIAVQSIYTGTYDVSYILPSWWWNDSSRRERNVMNGIIVQQPGEDQEWVVATDLSSKTPLTDPASAQALVALGMPRIGYDGGPPGLSAAQLAAIPTVKP